MSERATEPACTAGPASWCAVTDLVDVARIVEPGVQLCSWRRGGREGAPVVPRVADDGRVPTVIREVLSAGTTPDASALGRLTGHPSIVEDVTMLGIVLSDLVGCPFIGLRVAAVSRAMCPGWHVDRLALRLICTYRGPGTQWLADQSVNRASLGVAGAFPGRCARAAAGDVVLLKGTGWPGNERRGAVHRSPDVPAGAGARIVATLDPLWVG